VPDTPPELGSGADAADVGEGVGEAVCKGVGEGVCEAVGKGVGDGVGKGVGKAVGKAVGKGVGKGVGEAVGKGVGDGVGKGVGKAVGNAVGKGVGEGVGEVVGKGVGKSVGEDVAKSVGGGVGALVGAGAKATRLTDSPTAASPPQVPAGGSPVTQPVRLEAVMRSHLCEAVMDPAEGCASYIMAARPATWGHAMDVPEPWASASLLPMYVERMNVPGAQTSMQAP